MSETNPPPVAPVVTEEMVAAAEDAYDILAARDGVPYSYSNPMRAAITAALEASGEVGRMRAALKAAEDKQCASCRHCDSFGFSAALQGDAP